MACGGSGGGRRRGCSCGRPVWACRRRPGPRQGVHARLDVPVARTTGTWHTVARAVFACVVPRAGWEAKVVVRKCIKRPFENI
eukprot:scaffold161311_cov28-Tisochrysis_lutea.AAC.1